MSDVVIGSGFAGVAASSELIKAGRDVVVYESKPHWGGHTHTHRYDDFLFDEGPHVSFTPHERVRDTFTEGAQNVEEFAANITNYFRGVWLTHPAQVHLHGIDVELATQCIVDFVEAQHNPPEINTYADWLVAMYGKSFAENFPFAYTRKYWTVEPEAMGVDWVGSRMYPPKLDEVVRGALEPEQEGDFHYLKKFRYPTEGGYQSFMKAMVHEDKIRTSKALTEIRPDEKLIAFSDGTTTTYDNVVSTMPLPELVHAIPNAPQEMKDAADKLLCTSVVLVDVAVDRADISKHNWFYVYDEDISFARVHYPHMLSPGMAPAGKSSIQCEVYFSREKALDTPVDELPDRVVGELISMGVLRNREEVIFAKAKEVQYANIVFDHHRQPALDLIVPWVEAQGIVLAGRFGQWGYHWTDDATRAGWEAAETVLSRS